MRKLSPILIVLLFSLGGCAESYTVYVDGFAKSPTPIAQNARIYVTAEPNSENPLFDSEIKAKIVRMLASRGYQPLDDPASEYRLTFGHGITSHREEYYEYTGAGVGFHGGHTGLSATHYVPTIRSVWDQWLQIKIYHGDEAVWVGEAETTRSYVADKRRTVDYLLVGAFEFFGQNTVHQKTLTITAKDPRILDLEAYGQ